MLLTGSDSRSDSICDLLRMICHDESKNNQRQNRLKSYKLGPQPKAAINLIDISTDQSNISRLLLLIGSLYEYF